jgi:hypothetical protein
MRERSQAQIEQLSLLNLNIDWLINEYPLEKSVLKLHANVDELLSSLGVSGETRVIVRAAAVLGDLPFSVDNPKVSLARSKVIPNTVRTIRGALDLADETGVDIRLELHSTITYLENIEDHNTEADLEGLNLPINYLDFTLNPALDYLNDAKAILAQ